MLHHAVSAIAASPWLTFVASLIGGGVIGTLVSTYVTAGRDKREARAKVRELLAETEDLRWLDADYAEFRKALTRLESAAIIARFDRALLVRYTYLAQVARLAEIVTLRQFPDVPPRSLPVKLSALMEIVVTILANEAWRPRFWRFRRKRNIWVIDQMITSQRAERPNWSWDAVMIKPRLMTQRPGLEAAVERGLTRAARFMHIEQAVQPPVPSDDTGQP
jgi:hypothetical protein